MLSGFLLYRIYRLGAATARCKAPLGFKACLPPQAAQVQRHEEDRTAVFVTDSGAQETRVVSMMQERRGREFGWRTG